MKLIKSIMAKIFQFLILWIIFKLTEKNLIKFNGELN
jgi:hypothetical protein